MKMNNFEIKKKIVLTGASKVFKNWSEHSTITKEDFLEALEWVCADELNENGKMTREIGLTPDGIVKLTRGYGKEGVCSFYLDGQLWSGATWTREPETEMEKKFFGNMMMSEIHKISLSCKDRV